MRILVTTLLLLLAPGALLVSPAGAANPAPGVYESTDLGGLVLLGRAAQSWGAPLNALHGVTDVFNAQSWDGAALGTQWRFSCGVQPNAQVVQDFRDGNGTGAVIFTNTFVGGTFFLSKQGPWGDGVNDLGGTLTVTRLIVTVRYVLNVPQEARLNVDSDGLFHESNCTLTFVIANGIGGGDTDLVPKPPGYPDFIDPACQPTRTFGSWGDISQITLRIDCPVPSRRSTWGTLKATYR
jgi:hypothetical protein